MKWNLLLSGALIVSFTVFCHTPSPAQKHEKQDNHLSAREITTRIFSAILNKSQLNDNDLLHLSNHLNELESVLEQKLSAADAETKSYFSGIFEAIEDVRKAPTRAPEPGTGIYQTLYMVATQIKNNAVLAMVHEESLRHADKTVLATIRPNKGHGATYRSKETIKLAITALQESFIQIFFLSIPSDGDYTPTLQQLLFSPAPGTSSVSLAPGDTLILGEDGSFAVEPPYGNDLIIVVASRKPFKSINNTHTYQVPFPIDFAALFTNIYSKDAIDKISLHSCFIESKPGEQQ